ncbi:MAG: outer membrane protein assembly factor BamB family protein [Bdellovibrio sp.]
MFGLTEIAVQLDEATKLAIIPTVVLPFTVIGMILTSVATWIAAMFGVQLKAEGPKKLFEVLMKPKILLASLVLNLVIYGLIQSWQYVSNGPYPLWWIRFQNAKVEAVKTNIESKIVKAELGERPNVAADTILSEDKIKSAVKKLSEVEKISEVKTIWEIPIKDYVFGSPQVLDGRLYAGTNGGNLLEIDIQSGQITRKFQIGKPVMTSPVFDNNKIYVGEGIHTTHHARLYVFDLEKGKFENAFSTKGHIERAPVQGQDGSRKLLFIPSGVDGIHAIEAETMKPYWHADVGHVDSSPVVDSERIYGGTGLEKGFEETPTKAFALDIHSGATVWERSLPTSSWGIPVLWNDYVCYGVGDVYKNTEYGQLMCLDRKTGKNTLAFNTNGALISKPTIINDSVVVADIHGNIYQFNLKTKSLEWEINVPTKGHNYSSVYVDPMNRVILPGKEGLYIYDRSTQKLIYKWSPNNWKGTLTNITPYKNLWLLADAAGFIRALQPLP